LSLPNEGPTVSGRTSSSSSRSGSGSGSGSETISGRTSAKNGSTIVPLRPKLLSPQPWPLLQQNQLRRVMSPPPLSFGSRSIFEIKPDDDDTVPPSRSESQTELPSPTSPANHAGYQALVRQWCFAQGPTPNVSATPPRNSERMRPLTPDVVVR